MNAVMQIEEWRPDGAGSASLEQELDMLADILHAVVHTGAGVSFVVPFSLGEARGIGGDALWQELERDRLLEREVVGTVDLAHPAAAEERDQAIARRDDRAWREAARSRSRLSSIR